MAITPINVGTSANDGTGDPHRTAFQKTNNNINEVTTNGGAVINVTDPVDLATKELNTALANIYASGGGATPDLQAVTDVGNTITDGTDTNTVSANGISVNNGAGGITYVVNGEMGMTDGTNTNTIGVNGISFNDSSGNIGNYSRTGFQLNSATDETSFFVDKITVNSVDYPLPTGASSPLATLADITGGVSDGDKGDITVSLSGTVWTIDNGAVSNAKVASGIDAVKIGSGNVSNTEFDYLDGVTSAIQTQLDNRDVLPVIFEKHANVPVFGSASLNNLEGVVFVQSGATARTFADTNVYTRRQRMGLTVSVTGNLAQARQSITYFNRNSNLDIIVGVGFAENCTNANVRAFAGVCSNTAVFSNIEPTALLNCIGLAKLTTSNNLHLIHNDGSGTATAIDLGASFPSNTVETDFYILRLKTNGSNVDYTVTRVNTGGSTSGSLTTDLPATTQALNLGYYVVQNTGANTTTGIDYFGTNLIKS